MRSAPCGGGPRRDSTLHPGRKRVNQNVSRNSWQVPAVNGGATGRSPVNGAARVLARLTGLRPVGPCFSTAPARRIPRRERRGYRPKPRERGCPGFSPVDRASACRPVLQGRPRPDASPAVNGGATGQSPVNGADRDCSPVHGALACRPVLQHGTASRTSVGPHTALRPCPDPMYTIHARIVRGYAPDSEEMIGRAMRRKLPSRSPDILPARPRPRRPCPLAPFPARRRKADRPLVRAVSVLRPYPTGRRGAASGADSRAV